MRRIPTFRSLCLFVAMLLLVPPLARAQSSDPVTTVELKSQVEDLQKRVRELESILVKLQGNQAALGEAARESVEKKDAAHEVQPSMVAVPAEKSARSMKLSGLAFGDYYYVARNHDASLEDNNGFWLRRVYLTFDKPLNEALDARVRFEMSSAGDFKSSSRLTPSVKDAWLRWKFNGNQEAYLGISPTPTFEKIETLWPYRAVEKTPLDLQRMADTRDFGVALKGKLGGSERIDYHVMIGNGAGVAGETDHGKKGYFAVGVSPSKRTLLQFTADYETRSLKGDISTFQGVFGYSGPRGRLGFQYAHQRREGVPKLELDLFSAFTVVKATSGISLIARFDRMFDPNPDGASIAYLPFDSTAKSNFFLLGIDFKLLEELSLIPNVEVIRYDRMEDRSRPVTDVMPRLTFSYVF